MIGRFCKLLWGKKGLPMRERSQSNGRQPCDLHQPGPHLHPDARCSDKKAGLWRRRRERTGNWRTDRQHKEGHLLVSKGKGIRSRWCFSGKVAFVIGLGRVICCYLASPWMLNKTSNKGMKIYQVYQVYFDFQEYLYASVIFSESFLHFRRMHPIRKDHARWRGLQENTRKL